MQMYELCSKFSLNSIQPFVLIYIALWGENRVQKLLKKWNIHNKSKQLPLISKLQTIE